MACPRIVQSSTLLRTFAKGSHPFKTQVRHLPISAGYRAEKLKTFTQDDVDKFSHVSGDLNPLHMHADYAKTTRFGQPIVHGVLQLAVISALVGTDLPGAGSVALSYQVEHPHPLYLDEEMKAEVEVLEVDRRRIIMKMTCTAVLANKVTTLGTMKVLAPKELVL